MDAAFAWLSDLVSWLGQFFPRWTILKTTHGGVKFVRGSRVVKCGPGIHWYWPATTVFEEHPTARQSVNLKSQTITTLDGKTVIVGGLIVFEIHDIEAILAHTWDPDETIADITLGAIHDVCSARAWSDIQEQQRSGLLDRDLRREARKVLDTYGVRVLRLTLTDLAQARVLKIVQATTSD
jgi:regulator of protease activity HflC (stomatin/prohibitin superfamily)